MMKTYAFATALLLAGAAVAQSDTSASGTAAYDGDGVSTAAFETETGTSVVTATGAPIPGGAVVQPDNSDPERDARGIAVVSDPAIVPPGWNGTPAAAMGGPELDPVTGEEVGADETYPACTATVTDNCLQTYEKGRDSA